MSANNKKKTHDQRYSNPVRSIFSKKINKRNSAAKSISEDSFPVPANVDINVWQGMTKQEYRTAMAEASIGYIWIQCSIEPKDNLAKKEEYERIVQDIQQRAETDVNSCYTLDPFLSAYD